jgi:hypothetical protein
MWGIPAGATAIFVGCNRLAAWADDQLESDVKARLAAYLKSGQWVSQLDSVFAALQRPYDSLFGPTYFSLKALKRSTQLTLLITVPLALYYYFFIWVPMYWDTFILVLEKFGHFSSETTYYVWHNVPRLFVAILLDFLSVLRVRFLIRHLSYPTVGVWRCLAFLALEVLAVLAIFYLVWETYAAIENMHDLGSMVQWELDNQTIERVFNTFRLSILMRSLQSVYFYAGFAPSVWLFLFVLSVILLKALHALASYLRLLSQMLRFDKPLLTIGNAVGVLFAAFFIGAMWL